MPAELVATTRPLEHEEQRVVIRNTDCRDVDWVIDGCVCNGAGTVLDCALTMAPWVELGAPFCPPWKSHLPPRCDWE